jgi:hypothetical protein
MGDMPVVQIGHYLIHEQNNGKVYIENLDEESGEFDELLFEACIEKFFNERV